jgi:hypothetical protein
VVLFRYLPFGQRASGAAVACDGLVPGASLDLSHWDGNRTPLALKRDTSVEIALAFAEQRSDHRLEWVHNNHFDADGVLACWTLLRPEIALAHSGLITAAAEAGDFDEWPSDERGLWLEAAIGRLAEGLDDQEAYRRILPALDRLVPELDGQVALWGPRRDALEAERERIERGAVEVAREGRIALLIHHPPGLELEGPWIARLAPPGTDRWLIAVADVDGGWRYRYELPRYAWADTVRRPKIAAPRRGPIRRQLGAAWVIKDRRGMTGLAYTDRAIAEPPPAIARRLAALEADPISGPAG